MKHAILAIVLCASLSGCAWASQTVNDLLPSCENKAYGLASSLVVLDNTAHGYTALPICGSPKAIHGKLCSKIDAIETIKAAKNSAKISIRSAQKACNQNALQAAQTAFDAFSKIVSLYKK